MEITPDKWLRVQELFQEALGMDAARQSTLLDEADSGIRAVVMTLLRAHEIRGVLGPPPEDRVETGGANGSPAESHGPDDTMRVVAQALADRYRVERAVGRGGMAVVYLAHDLRLDRPVALKVMGAGLERAAGAGRFLQEVRLAANLHHPHILSVHDSGEAGGHLYYVMPFVNGESLRLRLQREVRLQPAEALRIGKAVAAALDHAHGQGVVHRDIKPDNILFHSGNPLVADFGIALALDAAVEGDGRLTVSGLLVGTPNYMSPEQIAGSAIDGRADVYALGCLLYECLSGEAPFPGPNPMAVATRHVTDPVPSISDRVDGFSPAADAVFRVALAKSAVDRFPTAGDLVQALSEACPAAGEPVAGQATHSPSAAAVHLPTPTSGPTVRDQDIRFCQAPDGVSIAYASVGDGMPLVKASNWLSHLEYDWQSPMWRHWWNGLGKRSRLVRYDARGTGLSDRTVDDISMDAWVEDLGAVIDAAGLDEFALLGVSQGGAIAIEYAVRHPERVSHLILHGAYARGRKARSSPDDVDQASLDVSLIRHGWGQENPTFRQVFSKLFMPNATPEQLAWFDEIQRVSATTENAARIVEATHWVDVREVATRVTAPTLVLHSTGDARVPFEEGRLLARLIPGARFVPLESVNHIPLGDEPAWPKFLDAVWQFLDQPSGAVR